MASFDKLIDFLLEKVALSGEEGTSGYRSRESKYRNLFAALYLVDGFMFSLPSRVSHVPFESHAAQPFSRLRPHER